MGARLLPFHESIIVEIGNALNATRLESLSRIILITEIPKNHDEIIKAWNEACQRIEGSEDRWGIVESVMAQKKKAREKSKKKKFKPHGAWYSAITGKQPGELTSLGKM